MNPEQLRQRLADLLTIMPLLQQKLTESTGDENRVAFDPLVVGYMRNAVENDLNLRDVHKEWENKRKERLKVAG